MPIIKITTQINAPIKDVFDAARSVDLHKQSTLFSEERAVAGRTHGLLELGEQTRWRAKHFGIWLELEVSITEMQTPNWFVDEMVEGNFSYMRHEHCFIEQSTSQTLMTDRFEFTSPLGPLGKLVDNLILTNYLTKFLKQRNQFLKEYLER